MTTQEVANRYMELAKEGKLIEIQQELYANEVECIEPKDSPMPGAKGKQAIMTRLKAWNDGLQEIHASSMTEPVVMGNFFSFGMMIDLTMKEFGRRKTEEMCVYEVRDGKIVLEQFFF